MEIKLQESLQQFNFIGPCVKEEELHALHDVSVSFEVLDRNPPIIPKNEKFMLCIRLIYIPEDNQPKPIESLVASVKRLQIEAEILKTAFRQ